MNVDHRQLLSLLDELMKPISTVKISNEDEQKNDLLTIDFIFSNACERFIETSQKLGLITSVNNDQPVYYRYVEIHLNLIEMVLSFEEKHQSSHVPIFSVQDESILHRSLDTVIFLGLILNFDEGIYHSIETYLKNSTSSIHLFKLKTNLTHNDRMYYLEKTTTNLMKYFQTKNVNSYVIQRLCSYHFLELILSHLQLIYSPNLKYCSHQFSTENLNENLYYLQKTFSNLFIEQILLLNRLLSTTINSPQWLKSQCGSILTSILIDSNNKGIRQIFQIILESTTPNQHLYVSMSNIISTCPKQMKPDEYIQRIKYQIVELIHDKRYMPILCLALNSLLKKYSKLIDNEIFAILFQPLVSIRNKQSNQISTDEQLELFINDLYNLIIITPNQQIKIYLYENYLYELINLYLALEKSISPLKRQYFQIGIELFSSINNNHLLIDYLEKIFFHWNFVSLKYQLDNDTSNFILFIDQYDENDIELFCQLVIKILISIENNDQLIVNIFLYFLKLLIKHHDHHAKSIFTDNDKQIRIIFILKNIMEYLTEHIEKFIKNVDDTISVIQIIIEKISKTYENKQQETLVTKPIDNDNDDIHDFSSDNEALQIVFTILSLLITHYDQLSSQNKQILASLYPSLKLIEQNHTNKEVCQIAHELSVCFVTFGAVKDVTYETKSNLLIEEINNERDLREETFENAFACLYDSSLPIRAHGLILFRRLIERSDKQTLNKIQEDNMNLFQRFQEHLHADDSYEYLAAINVLNALANRYTQQILPIICNEYTNSTRKLEDRLKVGEILVKTCRILGDMSTEYSSLLINTFLNASKQCDDDMYRASALSNLGQLCTVLKYSLRKDLPEILMALKNYLSIYESSDIRRASILVCELLCQSLEQSTWLTILADELPSFYKLINNLYKDDKDDVVRLHAQIALEALNQITRDYLQPPVILEKKIRILS